MLTPEQIAEGWLPHDGGPCPVDGNAMVEVLFSDGGTDLTYADFWGAAGVGLDDSWIWDCAAEDRIIAYRPEPAP